MVVKILIVDDDAHIRELLASQPGQIFTREQLITHIWRMNYEGDDRTVVVHIKRISLLVMHSHCRQILGKGFKEQPTGYRR
ncbi:DNA-binding response regulator [Paenibacillus sp. KN14-4R]|uniref:winged helix-turn-helix domain-containing protein n=1 Tax=Paenibacillus sp. KN14-4R TaxID=3445773 RepID=UPI003FA17094